MITLGYICTRCGKEKENSISYSFGLCKECFKERTREIVKEYNPKKATIFQTYIYEKIKMSCDHSNTIEYPKLKWIMINSHIPITLHQCFIDEMVQLKMIEKKVE